MLIWDAGTGLACYATVPAPLLIFKLLFFQDQLFFFSVIEKFQISYFSYTFKLQNRLCFLSFQLFYVKTINLSHFSAKSNVCLFLWTASINFICKQACFLGNMTHNFLSKIAEYLNDYECLSGNKNSPFFKIHFPCFVWAVTDAF